MNQIKSAVQQQKRDNLMYWFKRIRAHKVTANNGADATWIYFDIADDLSAEWHHPQQFKKDTFFIQ